MKKFHDFGSNTIESFSKIDYSIIKDEIIDYFDPVFYSNYPDMANSSEDEMLTHFSIHGGYKTIENQILCLISKNFKSYILGSSKLN